MMKNTKQKQSLHQFLAAKENRIGVIVLFIGVVAIIGVSIHAAKTYFPAKAKPPETLYTAANIPEPVPEYIKAKKPEKPKYQRQSNITEADIQGAWDGQGKSGRALLQLTKGQYKFAYVTQNSAAPNYFSMGSYTLRNDLLKFTPDTNAKKGRKEFPGYLMLTKSSFPLAVVKKGDLLILYKPDRSFGVYVPPLHPFLDLMPDEVGRFTPLK